MVPILYGAWASVEENKTGNRTINPAAGHFTDWAIQDHGQRWQTQKETGWTSWAVKIKASRNNETSVTIKQHGVISQRIQIFIP